MQTTTDNTADKPESVQTTNAIITESGNVQTTQNVQTTVPVTTWIWNETTTPASLEMTKSEMLRREFCRLKIFDEYSPYLIMQPVLLQSQTGDMIKQLILTPELYADELPETVSAEVYSLSGVDMSFAFAVRFEDEEYCNIYYNALYRPSTLGELIDGLDLTNNMSISSMQERSISPEEIKPKVSVDPDKVWTILNECRNCVLTEYPMVMGKLDLSIYVDITLLGRTDVTIAVSPKGYIYTSLAGPGAYIDIGEEKAAKYISFLLGA